MIGNIYRLACIGLQSFGGYINAEHQITGTIGLYIVLIINNGNGAFKHCIRLSIAIDELDGQSYRFAHNSAGTGAVADGVGELPSLKILYGYWGKLDIIYSFA
ncbi:hypothetical protein Misp06_03033 [Microbulbifer sp. NBRC 101763]|uniref:hypothetical protein n=1 Tax=Microbulbifer sp. NBRC 101763 TaxID=1113820 RepID=UPI0030A11E63